MRVIGRRKARNNPPAQEQPPQPEASEASEASEAEAPEWRVIGPLEDGGGERAAEEVEEAHRAETAPFDQAAEEEAPDEESEPPTSVSEEPEEASSADQPTSTAGGTSLDASAEAQPEGEPLAAGEPAVGELAVGEPAAEEPNAGEPEPAVEIEADPVAETAADPVAETAEDSAAYVEVQPPDLGPDDEVVTEPPPPAVAPEPAPVPPSGEGRPRHAAAEEDPVSSVLQGPGPQGQRTLPRVMAIANQKGGVGKTTTTVNLGAALAELGYRVLVVDLDPQGNATTGLGIDARNFENSMYDVIMHETPMEDCIEPTTVRNLFVAPATIDLAGVEIELVPAFSRELRLRKAIERIVDDFDFVMIDCPPSLGLITVNGLAAASEVLVPIQCEYYALEGLSQLLRNVHLVASNLNEQLEVSAIVLTMYDGRTRLAVDVAAEVRQHFKDKVCRNVIPRTIRLSEAPSFGQPITVFDPTSRGAIAYRELAKEVSNGAPKRAG